MGDSMLQPDYLRHEAVYAANPTATGWNDAAVDQEIRSYVDELLQQARVAPPASLLELGCGMGNLAIPLAGAGFQVVGIDISATAIAAATQRSLAAGSGANFQVGDVTAEETYRELGTFDCILDGLCWHCIIGQDRQAFLSFVRSALKPGGCFLVMTMCGEPRASRLRARFDPASRAITDGRVAERYLGRPDDLQEELRAAGFDLAYHRLVSGNDDSGDQDMLLALARSI
jgi:SAM-dependent methyltransferase